jgi:hypothetical protein
VIASRRTNSPGVLENVAVPRNRFDPIDVVFFGMTREKHDRQLSDLEDSSCSLGTVDTGTEVDVHQDEIDLLVLTNAIDRSLSRPGPDHCQAAACESSLFCERDQRLVLDEEYCRFPFHPEFYLLYCLPGYSYPFVAPEQQQTSRIRREKPGNASDGPLREKRTVAYRDVFGPSVSAGWSARAP